MMPHQHVSISQYVVSLASISAIHPSQRFSAKDGCIAKKRREWEMLNTISSMDCDAQAMMIHSVENERLLQALESAAGEEDGFWIVKSTYADPLHRHRKAHYQVIGTYGLRDLLNSADLANGFDIGFSSAPSPNCVLVAHGAAYAACKRGGHVTRVMEKRG